ncbi:PIN domain-containing protein [Candidatus Woesearchaeota archaeon]|nr:PIN domain-containing protein [Candidatus Woesearchaeota archaeon]
MSEKYLLDTQIWIDHYLKREPFAETALKLILKTIKEDSIIIFSNFNEKEMKDVGLSSDEINSLLSIIKPDHIKRVSVTKSQFEEAKRLARQRDIPLGDTIHALLARDHEAQLVSRDEKDFRKLKDVAIMAEPKDLV